MNTKFSYKMFKSNKCVDEAEHVSMRHQSIMIFHFLQTNHLYKHIQCAKQLVSTQKSHGNAVV